MAQTAAHLVNHVIPYVPVRQWVLSLPIPLRLLLAEKPKLVTPMLQRVQTNAAGQVVLKLKTPWRDGTTHLVMSPLAFMQRLAALVPRPRLRLIRFHDVLAPNAELRALVVPQDPEAPEAKPAECEAHCAHHRPVRLSWAKFLKRVFDLDLEQCPNCCGELKIIAAILKQPVIAKTLTHLGLRARAPPRAPARGQALQAA